MQELAPEPVPAASAVLGVAGDGVADRRKMDPDLVRAAGFQTSLDEGVGGEDLETSKWVRASREPAPFTARLVRRRRSLPSGASIVPVRLSR